MESNPLGQYECICRLVRQAARSLTNAYDTALAPSSLKTTQFTMLNTLASRTAASVGELSDLLGLDQTTTTRNVKVLEDAGLIQQVAHHDPRVKLVKLTKKGKQRRQAAFACWLDVQDKITTSLSDEEWKSFRQVLEKIEASAKSTT